MEPEQFFISFLEEPLEILEEEEEECASQIASQQTKINHFPINVKKHKYLACRAKSRNFLSSMDFNGITKKYFFDETFIKEVFVLLTKNLSPFFLNQKIKDKTKQEMIYMLWKECIPPKFYKYICNKTIIYILMDKISSV